MIRILSFFVGNILIAFRYRNKKDPFKLFEIMTRERQIDYKSKKDMSILIAPIRVSPMSNLFEGLLAYFFKIRGYKVKAIMCNNSVRFCDNISYYNKNKGLRCALCVKEQKRFCKVFGVESINIKDVVDDDELKRIDQEISKRRFEADEDFIYKGVNLKDDVLAGTMRYTLKSDASGDIKYIREFARTSFIFSTALRYILSNNRVKVMILSHGIYSTWGSLLTTAKELNQKSLVWGRGYLGQGAILFGHGRNYHEEFAYEDQKIWKKEILDNNQIRKTQLYFESKTDFKNKKSDYVNYYSEMQLSKFDIRKFWHEIESYKIKVGMYTNIPWDGQVFNKTAGFPNTKIYAQATINWFLDNKDCCLIIRAHPAEKTGSESKVAESFSDLLSKEYPVLPSNVYFLEADNPISSYDLAKKVDCSILYGSSLSLEFAVAGYTVIQTGRFNVSNKGIVYEANDKFLLYKYLERLKDGRLRMTEEMIQNALKYGYYWIFRRHIEDTTVKLNKLAFEEFSFKNVEEFTNDSILNFVYNRIENNELLIN